MALYEPGSRIRFVRHDGFIGEKPAIEAVEFLIYTDPKLTLLKLKAHELGEGVLTPAQYREEIEPYEHGAPPPKDSPFFDGRIHCERVPKFSFYYIGWNENRPFFADKRVRRAMTYALNRPEIIDGVLARMGKISTGPFDADSPANDPSIEPLPFDLGEAKKLLEEAGFRDTDGDGILDKALHPGDSKRAPFEFTLLVYASSKEFGSLANIYKEDLLKIGVKMNIEAPEWSLMQKRMEEKSFDAYTGGWGTTPDDDLYQIWHSSQADIPHGSNRIAFRNKEADALSEKLRVTFDRKERLDVFHAFHRLIHEEQPYTFLISKKDFECTWTDVKDVVFSKVRPAINSLPWSMAVAP
jgi:ABC-type transport system substrate-binding protein